uniref:Uncharacterized protein n=1 Tax=Arundo donax TaxID=35708 RepID=A0A0A9C9C4_ARUDO
MRSRASHSTRSMGSSSSRHPAAPPAPPHRGSASPAAPHLASPARCAAREREEGGRRISGSPPPAPGAASLVAAPATGSGLDGGSGPLLLDERCFVLPLRHGGGEGELALVRAASLAASVFARNEGGEAGELPPTASSRATKEGKRRGSRERLCRIR